MFFLIPEDKRVLIFYILIILLGIFLEYLEIISTEKVIGIGILLAILFYFLKTLIFGTCDKDSCDNDSRK